MGNRRGLAFALSLLSLCFSGSAFARESSTCVARLKPQTESLLHFQPGEALDDPRKTAMVAGHFRVKQILPKVFLVTFKTRTELELTFQRFQTYFETPDLYSPRNVDTKEGYLTWLEWLNIQLLQYTKQSRFVISGTSFIPFYLGAKERYTPLRKRERVLLDFFANTDYPSAYMIGTYSNSRKNLRHEIALSLFATNVKYQSKVLTILSKLKKAPFKVHLTRERGHLPVIYRNEIHALLLDAYYDDGAFLKSQGIDLEPYHNAIKKLHKRFEEYTEHSF